MTTRKKRLLIDILNDKYLYLMLVPGIVLLFIFSYMPMYGLVMAFKSYSTRLGIMGSPWAGLTHFKKLFSLPESEFVIFNTIRISFFNLILGFPAPIILSLLLNELRLPRFKRGVQSVLYMPHFVSWVVISGLLYSFFSTTVGVFSKVVMAVGLPPANVIANPNTFRQLLYATNIWKSAGWGTIIYMAAIAGVDPALYESAEIDGANRLQRMLHITLPSIRFSITTMLILSVGGIMSGNFDQIMNLRTAPTTQISQVIDTYVFDMGITKGRYDFATAVGLFQQGINFMLMLTTNGIVKKMSGEGFF